MTATETIEATLVRFTDDDRQDLLSAPYGFPWEYAVEFKMDDNGQDFAIVTPGYPDDAPARLLVAPTRAGSFAVTDCLSGRTLNTPTLADGINLMRRMLAVEETRQVHPAHFSMTRGLP